MRRDTSGVPNCRGRSRGDFEIACRVVADEVECVAARAARQGQRAQRPSGVLREAGKDPVAREVDCVRRREIGDPAEKSVRIDEVDRARAAQEVDRLSCGDRRVEFERRGARNLVASLPRDRALKIKRSGRNFDCSGIGHGWRDRACSGPAGLLEQPGVLYIGSG